MDYSPVFLIGSERSGTNLLRVKITENQDVYFGPEAAHFYKHLYNAAPYYGDFNNDKNFYLFIDDALQLCYNHFAPWQVSFKKDQILKEYSAKFNTRNAILLGHFLMQKYALSMGYKTYFCKDNFLYDYVFQILHFLPDAKFIYLYRDPRDYSLSQVKRSLITNDIYKIAQLWRSEQVKCLAVMELLNSNNIYTISYEEFIQNEDSELDRIISFLNTARSTEKKDYTPMGYSQEWENLKKDVIKNNFGKYKAGLRKKQIKIIEAICWSQMLKLDYKPENQSRPKINKLNEFVCRYFFIIHRRIKLPFIKRKKEFQWSAKRSKLIRRIQRY